MAKILYSQKNDQEAVARKWSVKKEFLQAATEGVP